MAIHETFGKGRNVKNPKDKIKTPLPIAKAIIDKFNLQGKVLDPFRGEGAFYNQFPNNVEKYWCEIDEDKDFFQFNEKVDWIISNPPYSIYDEVMEHSCKIADNVVYLLPLNKVFSSMGRIRKINKYGGIVSMWIIGASKCGFPFGFPACVFYFKKGYKGDTEIIIDE